MKKIMIVLLIGALSISSFAQTQSEWKKRPTLSVNFFMQDFTTPNLIRNSSLGTVLNDKSWSKIKNMSPGISVSYFEGITDHLDFMATLGGSFTDYPIENKGAFNNDYFLLEGDANVNLKLLKDKYFLNPFASIGIGGSMYKGTYFAAYMPIGGGLQFNLGNTDAFLFTQFSYRLKVSDLSNYHFNYSIGFGSPLTERKIVKVTPPPPAPVVVAPKDTDKDGIVDSLDKCPTVAGIAKYNGCPVPDSDADGINDDNDKCPTVKGTAKYDGCPVPDTDKDGINDEADKCPTVAGLARYNGCPIPDTDGDGLNDEEDKCPAVAGPKYNNGCPVITEEKKQKVEMAAKNIFFATGSATLLKKSNAALDQIVALLKETGNETLGVDIEGHTDNVGKAPLNLKLSQARANAVLTALKKRGVPATKLTATGYGLTQPIADNKTAAGRALNRRVEIKLKEIAQ